MLFLIGGNAEDGNHNHDEDVDRVCRVPNVQ